LEMKNLQHERPKCNWVFKSEKLRLNVGY
jgi:hypothetical protein